MTFSSIYSVISSLFRTGDSASWKVAGGINPYTDSSPPSPEESKGIAAIFQSINLLSDPVCSAPWRVMANIDTGGSKPVKNKANLLINNWSFEGKEAFIFDTLVNGNGFAAIRKNKLETINARRVNIAVDEKGQQWYEIQEDPNANLPAEIIKQEDIIHLKYRVHGKDLRIGISPLLEVAPSIERVVVINRAGISVFKNLAAPGIILSIEGRVSDESAQFIKENWNEKYSGKNRGKTALLSEGVKASILDSGNASDFQIAELDRVNTLLISRVFGIPPSLLGETGGVNYSTSIEVTRAFYALTLKPWTTRISDCFGQALLSESERLKGVKVHIDLSSLIRGEGTELSEYLSRMVNAGIITVNESRNMIGLTDVKDGNEIRSPVNTEPLYQWISPNKQQVP
ncbi:MAG: phage portal protein [gamma proteobacterium symbiont of Taylorina sp.]|nr:phage portal protein [gamma proteobacterium symbiont of Taylorina sp.]